MNAHLKRWLTAAVAVPGLFAIIGFASEAVFGLLILAVIVVGVFEYNRLVFGHPFCWEKMEGLVLALLVPPLFFIGNASAVLAVVTLSLLAVFCLYLLRITNEHPDVVPVMKVVFGFFYIPLTLSHFIWLRQGEQGVIWIFFVIVLAFSGDVAAFYVGRTFGKRKLIPLVSSGKTVAGILGLVAGSTICCLVYAYWFMPGLFWLHAAILGFVGSILGQLGDLCESVIKRASGVKDSGAILPGHGGILDRLDCLIFIVPFVYYYRQIIVS